MMVAYTFTTSFASSRSMIVLLLLFSWRSLSMGSMMRSFSPRHQESAPAMGGRFHVIGGSSRSVRNSSWTRLRSLPYACTSVMCFFSSSSWMMGRSSSPSNESSSLNLP